MILKDNVGKITGELTIEIRDAKTGRLKSRDIIKNMFVNNGRNSLAKGLTGATGFGIITYCALGIGAATALITDTALQNEIARKQISSSSYLLKVATFQTYFGISEANGTLTEAGLFGDDANSTPGSGTLFARTNINRTKTTNDTLTLSWSITIG